MSKILVCGAGGFIGGHLIADLRPQGAMLLGGEPSTRLRDGLAKTYAWIEDEIARGESSVVNR